MKYNELEVGMIVRPITNAAKTWGLCRVVEKTPHNGVVLVEEYGRSRIVRHFVNASKLKGAE